MKFFIYDNVNGNVQLNSEGLLVISEFANLLSNDRNKTKEDKLGKKGKGRLENLHISTYL